MAIARRSAAVSGAVVMSNQASTSSIVEATVRYHKPATLDELLARETADLYSEFARPVSIFAVCEVLGVPATHRARYREIFVGDSIAVASGPDESVAFAREILQIKADAPGEDTASDLIRSDLTEDERLGVFLNLLGAAPGSVSFVISTSVASLLLAPDQWAILRDDPARIAGAVEELVRFNSLFLSGHPRSVVEDATIDGIAFRQGESVWVSPIGANRDPARFEDPDALDITRDAYGHLAFGHGVHSCIGQQLARALITESIVQLVDRAPGMRLLEAQQLNPLPFDGYLPVYSPGRVVVAWKHVA